MSLPARETNEPGLDPEPVAAPTAYAPAPRTPARRTAERLEADPGVVRKAEMEPETEAKPRRPRRRGPRGPSGLAPRPGVIPGLDGLRAIAVAAVLLYHFLPGSLPGGFLGVDVFFVVSGFLISTLLLREIHQRGRIDLPRFWTRRARRLLPSLLLVVVVSATAARLVGGDLLVGIGRQVLGALTFTTNWLEIAEGASYFHSTSPILLVNLWSLAVEEQFYLLWPFALVLVVALARTPRQRVAAVAGIGLVSAVLMAALYDPSADATRVYYGTDTHLVGLMAGAALALAWADPTHRAGLRTAVWRRWRGWGVLGALLVLVGLMRFMPESSALTFRGGIALASVATVVLIAGLLEADGPWRRLMQLRPLTWLGQRSYAVYLWHWPVLLVLTALVPWAPGTLRGALVVLGALVLTLALAEASLRLVETPVRRHGVRASLRSLVSWLRTPWQESRTPRLVGAGLALAVLATAVAVATAPEVSRTQRQIEVTEARLAGLGTGGSTTGLTLGTGTEVGLAESKAAAEDGADTAVEDGADAAATKATTKDSVKAKRPTGPAVEVNGSEFHKDEDGLLVPAGEEITAFGDSMVVTSADGMTARFPGTAYLARSNRQWGDGATVLEQAIAADQVRDNVVIDLGTNAGVDAEALETALTALGPDRNVVVMDLYLSAPFTEDSNAAIREVVAHHPNAVVGEWAETVRRQPEILQDDRVHPDLEGMHVWAEVVAEGFDELAARG